MRRITNTTDLIIEQIKNLQDEESQGQSAIERNMGGIHSPELKMVMEYSEKQPAAKSVKPVKSRLYIKNMVSIRCVIVVKAVLENIGVNYLTVQLGDVEITEELSPEKREELKAALLKFGLELMEDKKNILIERIKNIIVEMIHYEEELPKIKFSHYLSKRLDHNYNYLSKLFSDVKGMTIEHFIILHKIERAKELIAYGELSFSEIAFQLHYSSIAHLSKQFKKITGLTLTHFKEIKQKRLTAIENL